MAAADPLVLGDRSPGAVSRREEPLDRPGSPAARPPYARVITAGALLLPAFVWAYWPTLRTLAVAWEREPDYSHGWLVGPLALLILWVRRDRFPGMAAGVAWLGLVPMGLAFVARYYAGFYHLEALDGWSILLWCMGVSWLVGGWRVLWWSLPAILFLWFLVPLPFRFERMLSLPLQKIATILSAWTLQVLGQPALAESNTLFLGDHRLEVAQACSGMRIFVGIFALAFAYIALARRRWWENIILLLSALPVALVANTARIVVTAMLYEHVSGEAAKRFTHDFAGWVMIPLAAALFAVVLWYVNRLMIEAEPFDMRAVVKVRRTTRQETP